MQNRLVGLDAWRSILLFYGVLVHASNMVRTIPGDPLVFNIIQSTSRVARMQAFFLIAGFLAARSIGKRGRAEWLRDRIAQLFIPLVVIWLTFQRLTDWVTTGDPFRTVHRIDHLWFLVVLIGFSVLTYIAQGPSAKKLVAQAAIRFGDMSPAGLVLIVTGLTFAATLAMQVTYMTFPAVGHKEGVYANFYALTRVFVMVVFYAAGHLLAQEHCITRLSARPLFAISIVATTVYLLLYDPASYGAVQLPGLPPIAATLAMYLAFAAAGSCFSLAVLVHARSVTAVPGYVMSLSRASYTVYLVHLFYVKAAFFALYAVSSSHYLIFSGTVTVAFSLSLLTHRVISASPSLQLLFNGKLPTRARAERSFA